MKKSKKDTKVIKKYRKNTQKNSPTSHVFRIFKFGSWAELGGREVALQSKLYTLQLCTHGSYGLAKYIKMFVSKCCIFRKYGRARKINKSILFRFS